MNTRKEKTHMEYKVQNQFTRQHKSLVTIGLTTLNTVRERGGVDTLTVICEDIFSRIHRQVQINDWLWFRLDFI